MEAISKIYSKICIVMQNAGVIYCENVTSIMVETALGKCHYLAFRFQESSSY